ncbi:hypothetical protein BDZ91DRAFT_317862 [Kalaharituber pfeilii]|nr:hypothetical protein BDZ91DRAFT_317862 [Kalaharituber pfeilii]
MRPQAQLPATRSCSSFPCKSRLFRPWNPALLLLCIDLAPESCTVGSGSRLPVRSKPGPLAQFSVLLVKPSASGSSGPLRHSQIHPHLAMRTQNGHSTIRCSTIPELHAAFFYFHLQRAA